LSPVRKPLSGINNTVRATRESSHEELFTKARGRIDEIVAGGATTVEIKSGYGLNVDSESKMLEVATAIRNGVQNNGGNPNSSGIKQRNYGTPNTATQTPWEVTPHVVRSFLGAHTIPLEHRESRDKYVNQVITEQLPAVLGKAARRGNASSTSIDLERDWQISPSTSLADHIDIFVDKGAFTLDEGRRILEAGKQMGLKVKAHAEQIQYTGCAQLVADLGGLSADHLERLDEAGAAEMGKKNVVAVVRLILSLKFSHYN
jgi:imidazolonepropionase